MHLFLNERSQIILSEIVIPATYYLNADLICTKVVPSLIGVCLTCDNAMLFVSTCCCYVFMHVCCINLYEFNKL